MKSPRENEHFFPLKEYFERLRALRRIQLQDALAGKNSFEKIEKKNSGVEENWEKTDNESISVMTPWSSLLRLADNDQILPVIHNHDALSSEPFRDKTLNIALAKAVRGVMVSLGLDRHTAQKEVLRAWSRNRNAHRDAPKTVRFFRDFQESALTECDQCGFENELEWEICENCGEKSA